MLMNLIPGAETARKKVLDLRNWSPGEQNFRVIQAFEAMRIEDNFCVVSDYDPQPLKRQLHGELEGRFEWYELTNGPDVWEVLIVKKASG